MFTPKKYLKRLLIKTVVNEDISRLNSDARGGRRQSIGRQGSSVAGRKIGQISNKGVSNPNPHREVHKALRIEG